MFDLGWSELFVIAVIAVIVVGPKELPGMLRTFGNFVARMKRTAADFQRQFNDAVRETELEDVKKQFESMASVDEEVKSALAPVSADIERELQATGDMISVKAEPTDADAQGSPPDAPAPAEVERAEVGPAEVETEPEPVHDDGGPARGPRP